MSNGWAADFDKDYICYNILEDGQSVEVAKPYYQCDYRGDIIIPESVEYEGNNYTVKGIQQYAFYNAAEVQSVVIPKTIRYIGENAFYHCDNLKKVDISNLTNWCKIDFQGDLWFSNPISRYGLEHLLVNGEEVTELVIPDDVEEISRNAFYWCTPLHSIEVPGTVKTIGEDAFYRCVNVKKLILHEGITTIKKGGVANLGTLTITVPKSIEYMESKALNYENTESFLRNICVQVPNPNAIQFDDLGLEGVIISVPSGAIEAYRNHPYWGQFTIVGDIDEEQFSKGVVRLDYFYAEETLVKKNSTGLFSPSMHVYPGCQSEGALTCDFALGFYQNGEMKALADYFWHGWTFHDGQTCMFNNTIGIYKSDIEDGDYQMRVLYRIGDEEWKPTINNENVYIDVTVKGDEMTLRNRYLNGAKIKLESFTVNGLPKLGHDMKFTTIVSNEGLKRSGCLFLYVNDMARAILRPVIKPQETEELVFQEGWNDYIFKPQVSENYTFTVVDGEGEVLTQQEVVIPEAETNHLSLVKMDVENLYGEIMASKENLSINVEVKNDGNTPYNDEIKFVTRRIWGFYEDGDTLISNNGSVHRSLVAEAGKSGLCHFEYIDYDHYNKIGISPYPPYEGLYSVEAYYYSDGEEVLLGKTPYLLWIDPEEYEGKTLVRPVGFSREYGDENPEIKYSVYGGVLVGEPLITGEASADSPVGHYEIKCEKGDVTNDNVEYVNSVMSVKKAPLTVTANSYSRKQGEVNPVFELIYQGFKNHETEDVLTVKPKATTTASPTSPVGTYPITVAGGEAQNYSFLYVDGVLSVLDADGIDNQFVDEQLFDVYHIDGQKVLSGTNSLRSLPKGIYIINGKKVLIK